MDKIRKPIGVLYLQILDIGGRELLRMSEQNLIVATGYRAVIDALAGVEGARIKSIAVGINGVEPTEDDTTITEAFTIDVQKVEYTGDNIARFHFSLGYEDALGMNIREFGLITADGRLFSRKTREVIEKTQYMSIVGHWDIKI